MRFCGLVNSQSHSQEISDNQVANPIGPPASPAQADDQHGPTTGREQVAYLQALPQPTDA